MELLTDLQRMVKWHAVVFMGFMLTGCADYGVFSQRKYRPGYFYERADQRSLSTTLPAKGHFSRTSEACISAEDQVVIPPETCTLGQPHASKPKDSVKQRSRMTDQVTGLVAVTEYSETELPAKRHAAPDPEREAKRAFNLGMWSLICLYVFFLAALPLAIMAVVAANRVLAFKDSTAEQKRKARNGKIMGSITISIFLLPLAVVLFLIYIGIIKFP